MSAPSQAHEERVELLRTIAALAGFGCDIVVGDAVIPDVARVSLSSRALFLGDAKATETSGCNATSERLVRYVRAVDANIGSRRSILFVIAHGDLSDQHGWAKALEQALGRAMWPSVHARGSRFIDHECVLTWVRSGVS